MTPPLNDPDVRDPNLEEDVPIDSDDGFELVDEEGEVNVEALAPGELPTALRKLRARQVVIAAAFILATTLLLLHFKTIQCCIGYLVAIALLWKAFVMARDYNTGKIEEVAVVCTSIHYSAVRKVIGGGYTRVVFSTSGDSPVFYRFNVPGLVKDIDVDGVFIIYFRPTSPDQLLAYVPIS